jgi:hypothetical protein
VLDTWYTQITMEAIKQRVRGDRAAMSQVLRAEKRARSRTSEAVVPKLTAVVDGHWKIKDEPPVLFHFELEKLDFEKFIRKHFDRYRESLAPFRLELLNRFRFEDVAIKAVGVGSVGTRCYLALLVADGAEPLFLQLKEARRSVLESPRGKSRFEHQGARVVYGQRLMQAASDIFLGWFRSTLGHDFYVRQFRDMKISAEIETFKSGTLVRYATLCGWALARAHAKAGDPAMISGYLGSSDQFDVALAKYSHAYADQAERDFELFQRAVRSGRLRTEPAEGAGLGFLL